MKSESFATELLDKYDFDRRIEDLSPLEVWLIDRLYDSQSVVITGKSIAELNRNRPYRNYENESTPF